MDDRRFDSLTRAVAAGSSRRTLLKGLLGLGGIAAVGAAAIDDPVRAATRPTPVPSTPKCPGKQRWSGSACVCPTGAKCGAECCAAGSQCCDGACCQGTCYGEEQCCPTGQLVCNGVCLPPGACCTDADCTGARCQGNVCVAYTPTNTPTNSPTATTSNTPTGTPTDIATSTPTETTTTPPTATATGCVPTRTCADVEAFACPSAFDDGCGGLLDCSGNCDARLSCVSGQCINMTAECFADSKCVNSPLSSCLSNRGFCRTGVFGNLVCVDFIYEMPNSPACGACRTDTQCSLRGDPDSVCLASAFSCGICGSGEAIGGDGCGQALYA